MNGGDAPRAPQAAVTDRGFAWVVLAAAFLINTALTIPYVAFGILYIAFSEAFQESKAVIGWVGSLFSFMSMITGLFIAGPSSRHGCRPFALAGAVLLAGGCIISSFAVNVYYLYISFGLIAGAGFGLINFCAVVVVQNYFSKRRALAGGIALAGQPLGAFVGALMTRVCVNHYGWRGALLLIGGSSLHCLPLAALFRPLPKPRSHTPPPSITWTKYVLSIFDFSLMRNLEYVLFTVCAVSATFGFSMYYLNLPSRAVSLNLTFEQAAWLPPFISLSSCVSRIFLSWVANLKCTNRLVMYAVLPFVAGLVAITSNLSATFPYMATNAALYGCMVGSMLSIMPAIEVDMFGQENLARAHALLGLWFGVSGLIATPLAGFIYDMTKSYDIPFFIAGGFQFLGCFTMTIIVIRRQAKTQREPVNGSLLASNGKPSDLRTRREMDRVYALTLGSEMGSVASIPQECEQCDDKEQADDTAEV